MGSEGSPSPHVMTRPAGTGAGRVRLGRGSGVGLAGTDWPQDADMNARSARRRNNLFVNSDAPNSATQAGARADRLRAQADRGYYRSAWLENHDIRLTIGQRIR